MINFNLKNHERLVQSKHQNGYALLFISLIILLGIVLTALVTNKAMYFEQKLVANDYRTQEAFQAAEAGLEYGLAYLNANKSTILVNDPNNAGFIPILTNSSITNVAFANNTSYTITYSNSIQNSFSRIKISSLGSADSGAQTRSISQMTQVNTFVPVSPPLPLITQAGINLSGNLSIANTTGGQTIWSGGAVGLSGAASTTAAGGVTSSSSGLQSDVTQNSAGLSGLTGPQFFADFFGTTQANAQQNADVVYNNSGDTNYSTLLNGVTGQAIWINQTGGTAQFSGNATIGSPTNPVVLVVNGPLIANGNTTIYGMVYIANDWNNNGGGTLNIIGAAVVQGALSSTGTPNITYSPSVLNNLNQVGNYVKVPGSWIDY